MSWMKVANTQDVAVGEMIHIEVEEEDIALYHLDDGWYATSAICTHASQDLTKGRLDGGIVACPKHGGKFDVRTGSPVAFPCVIPLQTYPVEVRGDEVWLDFD
jgi:3-phenylpropionate/trans-cinnamate dioxygenase ferredoxin subunit